MRVVCLSATLLTFFLLVSCGSQASTPTYATDVPLDTLSQAVDEVLDMDSLVAMQDSYLQNAMQLDPTAFEAYVVKLNGMGVTVDEYGIFKAKDETEATAVAALAEGYLQFRMDNWMSEYMPEEYPKLEEAEVQTYGCYVLYTILDAEQAEQVQEAVSAALLVE